MGAAYHRGESEQSVTTPWPFIFAVAKYLGIDAFKIDLAATKGNTRVPSRFYTPEIDSITQSWEVDGWGWLNPEYERLGGTHRKNPTPANPNRMGWMEKAYRESQKRSGGGAQTCVLVPASTGTNWYRDWVHGKAYVVFLNGRITFVGHEDPYPKDLMLCLYSPEIAPGYDLWSWQE